MSCLCGILLDIGLVGIVILVAGDCAPKIKNWLAKRRQRRISREIERNMPG